MSWYLTSTATGYVSKRTDSAVQSAHKHVGTMDRYYVSDKAIIVFTVEGRKIIISKKYMSDAAIKEQVGRLDLLIGKPIGALFTNKQTLFAKSIVIKRITQCIL